MFIEIAERFGLIGSIDRMLIEKTMGQQVELNRRGRPITFSMNLSGKDLGDEEFLSFLKSKISATGADPERLVFEITETAAVHDLGRAIKFIKDLKSLGCHFALDDFGVGFSSFVYLKEMNVDYIKIEGSFIRKLHSNPNDRLFVKAMTDVAKGMEIKTIAEFVETEEPLKLLKEYGVDYAQGYHIGKPMPPQSLNAL
jgi:EAL domain-containing protein (putative c-di-GMP-specific phosphodiesterase class I)